MPSESTVMCLIRGLTQKLRCTLQIQCHVKITFFASDRIASILPWSPTILSQRRKLPRLKKPSRASPTLRAARFIKNILETKKSLETDMTWIQHFETKKTLGNGLNGLVLDVLHTKNSWKLTWMWFFRFYLFPLLPRPPFSMLQSSLKVS